MASTDDQAINFSLSATDETGAAIASAKKNLTQLGGVAETESVRGSSAMKGFSFAAKGVASELGISGGMARMFGHEAADLASTMGRSALAFGIAGIAVIAASKIYSHFSDETKKLREETVKNADASMKWIETARVDTKETDALREAKDRLWTVQRKQSEWDLAKGIREEEKAISELYEKIKGLKFRAENGSDTGSSGLFILMYGKKEKRESEFKQAQLDLEKHIAKLGEMKALSDIASGKSALARIKPEAKTEYDDFAFWKLYTETKNAQNQALLNNEASYLSARSNLYKAYGASDAEVYQADVDAFDAATQAKVATLIFKDDIDQYYSQRSMERMAKEAQYQRKADEDTAKNKITMLQGTSMVAGQIYELTGKKMKAFYYLQQVAAAGESFIQYQLAAAKASGQLGFFGVSMAAYYQAMSYVVPGLIMAKAFGVGAGGDSGGGEAMPTYSANSNTGLPESKTGDSFNLKLVINGQERTIADITSGVMRTLYNGNGSVDGFQVLVERSA